MDYKKKYLKYKKKYLHLKNLQKGGNYPFANKGCQCTSLCTPGRGTDKHWCWVHQTNCLNYEPQLSYNGYKWDYCDKPNSEIPKLHVEEKISSANYGESKIQESKLLTEEERFLSKNFYMLKPEINADLPLIDIPADGNCHFEVYAKVLKTTTKALRILVADNITEDHLKRYTRMSIIMNYLYNPKIKNGIFITQMLGSYLPHYKLLKNTKLINEDNQIFKKLDTKINEISHIVELISDEKLFNSFEYSKELLNQTRNLIKKYNNSDDKGLIYMEPYMVEIIHNIYPNLVNIVFERNHLNKYIRITIEKNKNINLKDKLYMFTELRNGAHTNLLYSGKYNWENIPNKIKIILKNLR